MSKVLVLPDIHGRWFWKEPCDDISQYDKVVFLGDYLDPYDFEGISEEDAILNFLEIIKFKQAYSDKVVLLLGNHDLPYFSATYNSFYSIHPRYSVRYHEVIDALFRNNENLFVLAYLSDDVLFTHSGVEEEWYKYELEGSDDDTPEMICERINALKDDMRKLFVVSYSRGGWKSYASCVWTDLEEMREQEHKSQMSDDANLPSVLRIKQIFGHTQQVCYDRKHNIVFGDAVLGDSFMMLDNGRGYVVDTELFEIINTFKSVTLPDNEKGERQSCK